MSCPSLKHPHAPIPRHIIQILRVGRPTAAFAAARDPHHSTDITRRPSVQQPQSHDLMRLVREGQRKRRMLLFQRRVLRVQQGVVRRDGEDGGMDFLRCV